MTILPPDHGDNRTLVGPGHFILVVGPSGAGKDTLIRLAQAACGDDADIVFAKRVITREASAAEDNEAIDKESFQAARERGAFALDWDAHGLHYGLPHTLLDDIRLGRTVVANGSRSVVEETRALFAYATVVLVTAPPDILAARLAARGRASDGALAARLSRVVTMIPDIVIENIDRPERHVEELLEIIRERPGLR